MRTRSGKEIATKVDGIFTTAKVNIGKVEALVEEQLTLMIPADQRSDADGPLLVLDENDLPVGVLWAGGEDEKGNLHGIVTPIKLWRSTVTS